MHLSVECEIQLNNSSLLYYGHDIKGLEVKLSWDDLGGAGGRKGIRSIHGSPTKLSTFYCPGLSDEP